MAGGGLFGFLIHRFFSAKKESETDKAIQELRDRVVKLEIKSERIDEVLEQIKELRVELKMELKDHRDGIERLITHYEEKIVR